MKKIASAVLAFFLLLGLAACRGGTGSGSNAGSSTPAQSPGAGEGNPSPSASDVNEGALGQLNTTLFFDFTVVSAQAVGSYGSLTAAAGNRLVDVVITTTNTYGQEIIMIEFDFQIQWGDGDDPTAFAYPLDAADETMAPLEFVLGVGETMEYHYVYEVPEAITGFMIAYEEAYIDVDGNEGYGDVYFVPFNVL